MKKEYSLWEFLWRLALIGGATVLKMIVMIIGLLFLVTLVLALLQGDAVFSNVGARFLVNVALAVSAVKFLREAFMKKQGFFELVMAYVALACMAFLFLMIVIGYLHSL